MLERAICLLLCITAPLDSYAKTIRTLISDENQVALVHTALGFSTILEFPSHPISAVLGDQDSFKLEYLGNSITVKPLVARGKSNLFVFTEYQRFNCTLVAGPAGEVDYLVKIAEPKRLEVQNGPSSMSPKPLLINRTGSFDGFELHVLSAVIPKMNSDPRSPLILQFELRSRFKKYVFTPASLGIRQENHFLTIENLYVESLTLLPGGGPIHGTLVVLNEEIPPGPRALSMVFAVSLKKKTHRISVPIRPKQSPVPTSEVKHG